MKLLKTIVLCALTSLTFFSTHGLKANDYVGKDDTFYKELAPLLARAGCERVLRFQSRSDEMIELAQSLTGEPISHSQTIMGWNSIGYDELAELWRAENGGFNSLESILSQRASIAAGLAADGLSLASMMIDTSHGFYARSKGRIGQSAELAASSLGTAFGVGAGLATSKLIKKLIPLHGKKRIALRLGAGLFVGFAIHRHGKSFAAYMREYVDGGFGIIENIECQSNTVFVRVKPRLVPWDPDGSPPDPLVCINGICDGQEGQNYCYKKNSYYCLVNYDFDMHRNLDINATDNDVFVDKFVGENNCEILKNRDIWSCDLSDGEKDRAVAFFIRGQDKIAAREERREEYQESQEEKNEEKNALKKEIAKKMAQMGELKDKLKSETKDKFAHLRKKVSESIAQEKEEEECETSIPPSKIPVKDSNTRSGAEALAIKLKCIQEKRGNCDSLNLKPLIVKGVELPPDAMRSVNQDQAALLKQKLYIRNDGLILTLEKCPKKAGTAKVENIPVYDGSKNMPDTIPAPVIIELDKDTVSTINTGRRD